MAQDFGNVNRLADRIAIRRSLDYSQDMQRLNLESMLRALVTARLVADSRAERLWWQSRAAAWRERALKEYRNGN
jgi:hypothetical protein